HRHPARVHSVLLATLVLTAISLVGGSHNARATPCSVATLGNSPRLADTFANAFYGRAWGETFVAMDTLVSAITVWRPPSDTNYDCSGLGNTPTSNYPAVDLEFQIEFCSPTTGVGDGGPGSRGPSLRLAGPNPARRTARFEFTLAHEEAFELAVVDVGGRRVAT